MTYRQAPALDASALQDFVDMLVEVRETLNVVLVYGDPDAAPPDPSRWAAAVVDAGRRHLREARHLRPVSLSPHFRSRAPAALSLPGAGRMHTAGWSDVREAAAGAVGLFSDPMSRVVRRWMQRYDDADPAAPWQLACRLMGEVVPEEQDALWRLRTGYGKVYDALPWREAVRMAEADGALARVSLVEQATIDACKTRLAKEPR